MLRPVHDVERVISDDGFWVALVVSTLTVALSAATTYLVRVSGYAGSVPAGVQGPFTLTVTQPDTTGDGPFRERLKGYGIEPKLAPDVLWNFEKFVIGRDGRVVDRFSPDVTADDPRLLAAIQIALSN